MSPEFLNIFYRRYSIVHSMKERDVIFRTSTNLVNIKLLILSFLCLGLAQLARLLIISTSDSPKNVLIQICDIVWVMTIAEIFLARCSRLWTVPIVSQSIKNHILNFRYPFSISTNPGTEVMSYIAITPPKFQFPSKTWNIAFQNTY